MKLVDRRRRKMNFDVEIFLSALTSRALITGAAVTLALTVSAHAVAIFISLPMAVALLGQSRFASRFVNAYIVLFRAVPLILLLLLIWNGLPQVDPVFREQWFTPFLAALIGLSLIEVAYQVEINRAALTAVARGQTDAGEALGLSQLQIFFLIELPQAARLRCLRP
jgi:His/Glu/Gln/Arg/opine family amino acid ABC transporter permease subunit